MQTLEEMMNELKYGTEYDDLPIYARCLITIKNLKEQLERIRK